MQVSKNQIKNVDFIASTRNKYTNLFDALIITMMQTICASFERVGSKLWTLSRKREKNDERTHERTEGNHAIT